MRNENPKGLKFTLSMAVGHENRQTSTSGSSEQNLVHYKTSHIFYSNKKLYILYFLCIEHLHSQLYFIRTEKRGDEEK